MLLDARNEDRNPLTIEKLLGWHAALFPSGYSGLQKIRVGHFRGKEEMQSVSGPIGREKVHFVAPHSDQGYDIAWLKYWFERFRKDMQRTGLQDEKPV